VVTQKLTMASLPEQMVAKATAKHTQLADQHLVAWASVAMQQRAVEHPVTVEKPKQLVAKVTTVVTPRQSVLVSVLAAHPLVQAQLAEKPETLDL
jgi:hypothetical protein